MAEPHFRRILIKLSGEALQGDQGYGISPPVLESIAEQIREVTELGVEVAIVIGGGNIFRGVRASAQGMDRASADYMHARHLYQFNGFTGCSRSPRLKDARSNSARN